METQELFSVLSFIEKEKSQILQNGLNEEVLEGVEDRHLLKAETMLKVFDFIRDHCKKEINDSQ